MAGDIEFERRRFSANERPDFAEHPVESVAISEVFKIAEKQNAIARREVRVNGGLRGDDRQVLLRKAGKKFLKTAEVGFRDVEKKIGAAIHFEFARFEVVAAFEVREEAAESGGASFAFTVAVIGEDGDARRGRMATNVIEIVFRDGNAGPEPLAENCDVKIAFAEQVFEGPGRFRVYAEVAKPVRIAGNYIDAELFDGGDVAFGVASVARDKRNVVALAAQLGEDVIETKIGTAAINLRNEFVDDENVARLGGDLGWRAGRCGLLNAAFGLRAERQIELFRKAIADRDGLSRE